MSLLADHADPPAAVAVVIAVWDDYVTMLPPCVDGVLAQAGVKVQTIVVDNASVTPIPDLPDQVVVVRAPRRLSAGAARNLGLGHVTAPLVLFLDADDLLLPGALRLLAGMLAAAPAAVAAVGKHVLWSPATGRELIVDRSPRPPVYRVARCRRLFALMTLRFDCYPLVGCAAVRTAAAMDAGGFGDSSLAEDWALRSALACRGEVKFTRDPVVRIRVRDGSLWHRDHSRAELDSMFAAFRERRLRDPRLSALGKLLLRPIAFAHRRDARRMTAAGMFRPAGEVLAHGAGSESVA
jgi:cellulose synthase/poly-beta-1,6-N-acetylglucosamine synthase-like glycosyltransferase